MKKLSFFSLVRLVSLCGEMPLMKDQIDILYAIYRTCKTKKKETQTVQLIKFQKDHMR